MKKSLYILFALMIFSFFVVSCGKKDTATDVTLDENDYTPALTEEDQIKESESDKEYYKRAKEEGNPALCEKINFTDLKKLCLEKAKEGQVVVEDDATDVKDEDAESY